MLNDILHTFTIAQPFGKNHTGGCKDHHVEAKLESRDGCWTVNIRSDS